MSPQQKAVGEASKFVDTFVTIILSPLITLLSAIAFLYFLYGCAEYIMNASNSSAREQGVRHILWGIIGLVIMASAWAIMQVATGTFGLNDELDCANKPNASGCSSVFKVDVPEIKKKGE
jgi:sorbitol-specific phosphotransferase system component IIC